MWWSKRTVPNCLFDVRIWLVCLNCELCDLRPTIKAKMLHQKCCTKYRIFSRVQSCVALYCHCFEQPIWIMFYNYSRKLWKYYVHGTDVGYSDTSILLSDLIA